MKTSTVTSVVFPLLIALGCSTPQAGAGGAKDADQSIAAAEAAQKKADALQGGWTTTDKLIEQAMQAAAKGDTKKALELSNKAEQEAKHALAQAEYEREHWSPPPYLLPDK